MLCFNLAKNINNEKFVKSIEKWPKNDAKTRSLLKTMSKLPLPMNTV